MYSICLRKQKQDGYVSAYFILIRNLLPHAYSFSWLHEITEISNAINKHFFGRCSDHFNQENRLYMYRTSSRIVFDAFLLLSKVRFIA